MNYSKRGLNKSWEWYGEFSKTLFKCFLIEKSGFIIYLNSDLTHKWSKTKQIELWKYWI